MLKKHYSTETGFNWFSFIFNLTTKHGPKSAIIDVDLSINDVDLIINVIDLTLLNASQPFSAYLSALLSRTTRL